MAKFKPLIVFCLLLILGLVFPSASIADAKTDYEYQLGQYRKSLAEFTQLKRDYLTNPTLDNQQKSMIVVKQTLLARDLSKSAYARFLGSEILARNTAYTGLDPILIRLSQASDFYLSQSQKSQSIITPADLKTFSTAYSAETIIHDRSFYYGQVAVKIAQVVRFQIDTKTILDTIYPKLPDPAPAPLKARLEEIPLLGAQVNEKIALLTSRIIPEEEEGAIMQEQYFTKAVEGLMEIRQMEARIVDQLVDIDINYAKL